MPPLSGPLQLPREADHPVVVTLAPVDGARLAAVGVGEQVEVVADELHPGQGVVHAHRVGGVDLAANDAGGYRFVGGGVRASWPPRGPGMPTPAGEPSTCRSSSRTAVAAPRPANTLARLPVTLRRSCERRSRASSFATAA